MLRMMRTYDINESYEFNYERGPMFDALPPEIPEGPMTSFLGIPVRSRLGIAAGLLLNSKWILEYAKWGFDILTYKTVRSRYRPCYKPPNWVFVEESDDAGGPVYAIDDPGPDPSRISSAVCFGMPSMAPDAWRKDVSRTRKGLGEGKILIVSVVASPAAGDDANAVAWDFRRCAEWAVEAGADVIEANFSCPNVCSPEGSIYMDASLSRAVATEIRRGIGGIPMLIKVGHVVGEKSLNELLAALEGVATGVTLVNGITRPVMRRNGDPVFGVDFVKAGVVGHAIHQPSLEQVILAKRLVAREGYSLQLGAVGGAGGVREIGDFFKAGAEAVLLGSSPMFNPGLAVEYRKFQAREE